MDTGGRVLVLKVQHQRRPTMHFPSLWFHRENTICPVGILRFELMVAVNVTVEPGRRLRGRESQPRRKPCDCTGNGIAAGQEKGISVVLS